MATQRICSIEGCGKPHWARGWCGSHYGRWHRYGSPSGRGAVVQGEALTYFEEVVIPYSGQDCLIWPFGRNTNGYAMLWSIPEKRMKYVHILVCEQTHGPQPFPGALARHLCGKGHEGCCANSHVAWGTQAENMGDARRHGTLVRGTKIVQARLTEADVIEIRSLSPGLSHEKIAKRFGVSRKCISKILARQSWAWLE